MTRAFVLAAMAGVVCVSPALAGPSARYRCTDGSQLTAAFDNNGGGSVTITFKGQPALTLPQAPSADGGRYTGQDIEFWIKGRSATLTRGGQAVTCTTR